MDTQHFLVFLSDRYDPGPGVLAWRNALSLVSIPGRYAPPPGVCPCSYLGNMLHPWCPYPADKLHLLVSLPGGHDAVQGVLILSLPNARVINQPRVYAVIVYKCAVKIRSVSDP